MWIRQDRCGHCGAAVAPQDVVEGRVRGVSYLYCAQDCYEEHSAGVELWSAWCACGEDVVGDSTFCDQHLGGDSADAEVSWRLAG